MVFLLPQVCVLFCFFPINSNVLEAGQLKVIQQPVTNQLELMAGPEVISPNCLSDVVMDFTLGDITLGVTEVSRS